MQEYDSKPYPDKLPCYECSRRAGRDVMDDEDCIKVSVVREGPVVNPADPTQSYVLACGHTTI